LAIVKTAIVIPAFNEAESIVSVVTAIGAYGTPIVVDDASTDETGARAAAAGALVVRHETNRGYDQALASGFAKAQEIGVDAIVSIDADGQLDSTAIPPALDKLKGRAQVVLGIRSTGAARFSEMLFNCYTRFRFGVPDILCGLKVFRTEAYARHRNCASAASVHTALALALLREGAPFAVVPVPVHPRRGHSRYGGVWRGNIRILRALVGALRDDLLAK
jgi:hypothetical protein